MNYFLLFGDGFVCQFKGGLSLFFFFYLLASAFFFFFFFFFFGPLVGLGCRTVALLAAFVVLGYSWGLPCGVFRCFFSLLGHGFLVVCG